MTRNEFKPILNRQDMNEVDRRKLLEAFDEQIKLFGNVNIIDITTLQNPKHEPLYSRIAFYDEALKYVKGYNNDVIISVAKLYRHLIGEEEKYFYPNLINVLKTIVDFTDKPCIAIGKNYDKSVKVISACAITKPKDDNRDIIINNINYRQHILTVNQVNNYIPFTTSSKYASDYETSDLNIVIFIPLDIEVYDLINKSINDEIWENILLGSYTTSSNYIHLNSIEIGTQLPRSLFHYIDHMSPFNIYFKYNNIYHVAIGDKYDDSNNIIIYFASIPGGLKSLTINSEDKIVNAELVE